MTMQAGPELDAVIAEKVMGWHQEDYYDKQWIDADGRGTSRYAMEMRSDECGDIIFPRWSPSTDIAAAWEVVEKLHENNWSVNLHYYAEKKRYEAAFVIESDDYIGEYAATAPLAICLAALKAVGCKDK